MKISIFFILAIFNFSAFSQSQLDNAISSKACNCLTQVPKVDEETFINCFFIAIKNDSALLLQECLATYGDTSDTSARKFGMAMYRRLSVNMIFTCDRYAQIIDSIRSDSYRVINLDSAKQSLKTLLTKNYQKPSAQIHTLEGIIYFKEGRFQAALASLDKAIQIDSTSFQAIFFKALSLEQIGKLEEAVSLYKYLSLTTGRNEFDIFAAIAERKKRK